MSGEDSGFAETPKSRKPRSGSLVEVLEVVLLSSLLAFLTVLIVGGVLIRQANDSSGQSSGRETVQLLGWIAAIGVLAAASGAVLRVLAHGHDTRKDQDYLGKLFGLGAVVFAMVSALGALVTPLPGLPGLLGPFGTSALVVVLSLAFLIVLFIFHWGARRRSS